MKPRGRPQNVDRMAALKRGAKHYQGASCAALHDGTRYVSTGACVECIRLRTRNVK